MKPPLHTQIPDSSTLAIVGAGPIGLEAAVAARQRGWDVQLFEKTAIGHHLRQWGHVQLFSPFSMNHSSGGLELIRDQRPDWKHPQPTDYLTGAELVRQYLEPLAALPIIRDRLWTGVQVQEIGREELSKKDWIGKLERLDYPFRLLLQRDSRETIHRAWAVIDASGVYSNPQGLGNGGIAAPGELRAHQAASAHLHYRVVDVLGADRSRLANRTTLLVGGGHSAATALEGFVTLVKTHPRTRVLWINRSSRERPYPLFRDDPLPYRDFLSRLGNQLVASPPDWLNYCGGTVIDALSYQLNRAQGAFELEVRTGSDRRRLRADEVVVNTGFRPDNSIYRQLQVHECYATSGPIKLAASLLGGSADCLQTKESSAEILRNPEPNFHILGNKSYGTNATFLLRHGLDQIDLVLEDLEETARKHPPPAAFASLLRPAETWP